MNFIEYFLNKRLDLQKQIINENNHVLVFCDKFPKVQHKDVEESFENAYKKVKKMKLSPEKEEEKIKEEMENSLIEISKNKKKIKKQLSCVKSVKFSASSDSIEKAEKILTSQEKKIIKMCVEGKSVRKIASNMDVSYTTVWRILNSAIDKIRVFNGIKPK